MKRLWLAGLLVSQSAFAESGSIASALGLGSSMLPYVLATARSLIPLMLCIGLVSALAFRDPFRPAEFRSPVWRAALAVLILSTLSSSAETGSIYSAAVVGAARLADSLSGLLASGDAFVAWQKLCDSKLEELNGTSGFTLDFLSLLGNALFTGLLSLGVLGGQASLWVMAQTARLLAVLLYVVGPLAIATLPLPRVDAFERWLRGYCNILSWSVLSTILLSLIAKVGVDGLRDATPMFTVVGTSVLLLACSFAVPSLADAVVGGGMNFIGAGLRVLLKVLSMPGAAVSAVSGSASGGSASSGGSSTL